jgi:hypothetical protein
MDLPCNMSLTALIYCGIHVSDIEREKYQMIHRNTSPGKILSAVLLLATLLFGGSIIVAIANSLPKENPLHFWLPPVFMFSYFVAFVIYLSRGKGEEEHQNSSKTQLDKCEPSQDASMNLATAESVETVHNNQSKNMVVKKNSKYLIICLIGCVVAFGILILSSFIAGGTAVNGKIETGRFFLGQYGNYTEVSRFGYVLSTANTFVLGVLFPFAAYALCSMSWKTEKTRKPSERFRLFFVVFASFIGGSLALTSLIDCILAILTVT